MQVTPRGKPEHTRTGQSPASSQRPASFHNFLGRQAGYQRLCELYACHSKLISLLSELALVFKLPCSSQAAHIVAQRIMQNRYDRTIVFRTKTVPSWSAGLRKLQCDTTP